MLYGVEVKKIFTLLVRSTSGHQCTKINKITKYSLTKTHPLTQKGFARCDSNQMKNLTRILRIVAFSVKEIEGNASTY